MSIPFLGLVNQEDIDVLLAGMISSDTTKAPVAASDLAKLPNIAALANLFDVSIDTSTPVQAASFVRAAAAYMCSRTAIAAHANQYMRSVAVTSD